MLAKEATLANLRPVKKHSWFLIVLVLCLALTAVQAAQSSSASPAPAKPAAKSAPGMDIAHTAALQASEEQQRARLTALPDLMFLQDRAGRYLEYHAGEAGNLLVSPAVFLGRSYQEVLPPDLAARFQDCFEWVASTGEMAVTGLLPICGWCRQVRDD